MEQRMMQVQQALRSQLAKVAQAGLVAQQVLMMILSATAASCQRPDHGGLLQS